MTTDKKSVALLADLLTKRGLQHLVHSPGSRNAPIIIAFSHCEQVEITTCVDERSAAFYAMGLALETGKPVAIDCTSGTAPLNYAPAIAEAYYQQIPLLVLTADRSAKHVNIGDGQTINQNNVFTNYVKKSFTLPQEIDEAADFSHAEKLINEAITTCIDPAPGPVHINIPLDEPLYQQNQEVIEGVAVVHESNESRSNPILPRHLVEHLKKSPKVMVVAGQMKPDKKLNEQLNLLRQKKNTVILTETTSNLYHPDDIDGIDNVVSTIQPKEVLEFTPDVLITFGGAIVSKMIKKFLRDNSPQHHWHLSASGEKLDTYFCLSGTFKANPAEVMELLSQHITSDSSDFKSRWLSRKKKVNQIRDAFLNNQEYCDLKVFDHIRKQLPKGVNLHLGNSTPVRYSQLFGSTPNTTYYSNRGVSGIDGQISTAAGIATASPEKLNILITGDLGFLYDNHGLLLLPHCPNLKIIVINNQGGGIFRFIPGPDTVAGFEEYFEAKHQLNFEHLAKAFHVEYAKARNIKELNEVLPTFFNNSSGSMVLEVQTPSELNAEILRQYFKTLKES